MLKNNTPWIFLGRFQPFHIGHMSIVDEILRNYDRLILIIGSAEKSGTEENPWTLEEREEIIRATIPLELQERMDIVWLADTADDDVWGMNLQNLVNNEEWNDVLKTLNSKLQTWAVLFTGNEWVRGICVRHDIQTQWIKSYDIDVSGTKIREMIKRGEDVSEFTIL